MKVKIETEVSADGAGNDIRWLTDACKVDIQKALDAVNGKATAFTVYHANRVYELSLQGESYLKEHGIPESDRAGATITFRPAGPYANAYKNSAISTTVTLSRTGGGWYLTAVERSAVYPRNPERFAVTISDRAADNLVRRSLKAFGRVAPEAAQQQQAA